MGPDWLILPVYLRVAVSRRRLLPSVAPALRFGLDNEKRNMSETTLREARAATLVTTPKGRGHGGHCRRHLQGWFLGPSMGGGEGRRPSGYQFGSYHPINRVTAREMALLQQLNAMRREGGPAAPDTALPQRLTVLGQTYLLSDAPGISWQMNPVDLRDRAGGSHGEATLRFHRVHDSYASVGNWRRRQQSRSRRLSR